MAERPLTIVLPPGIAAALPDMSSAEVVCTVFLAIATYGHRRGHAHISYKDIQQQTPLRGNTTISRAMKAVQQRGFFRRSDRSTWVIVEASEAAPLPGSRMPAASPKHNDDHCHRSAETDQVDASTPPAGKSHSAGATPVSGAATPLSGAATPLSRVVTPVSGAATPVSGVVTPVSGVSPPVLAPPASSHGTETEPPSRTDGTEIEPLPFNKEKDLLTGDLERERKRTRARDETAHLAGPSSPLSKIPRPRTPEENILAGHPATRTWLASGLAWPGWVRLRAITRRIGRSPQADKLQRAHEMWLMHGYRPDNIQGILDWYLALCRDDQWQPYQQAQPRAGHSHNTGSQPQEGLEMLLRMREERLNEQRHDSGLCDHAAVRLPTHQDQQGNHAHL